MQTNRASALVVHLPTAAPSLVANPPKRRGRYPRCVITFWEIRNRCQAKKDRQANTKEIAKMNRIIAAYTRMSDECRQEIALLRQRGESA